MRKELEKIEDERLTFIGKFERYGTKTSYRYTKKTLLLKDIKKVDDNKFMTDHLWFNLTKQFEALGDLGQGDVVQFDARVKEYVKGYVNRREYIDEREIDYKLSHPTKVKMIEKGNGEEKKEKKEKKEDKGDKQEGVDK